MRYITGRKNILRLELEAYISVAMSIPFCSVCNSELGPLNIEYTEPKAKTMLYYIILYYSFKYDSTRRLNISYLTESKVAENFRRVYNRPTSGMRCLLLPPRSGRLSPVRQT